MPLKRSCDSLQSTTVLAARPWRRAFIDAIAFPSGVFGPDDLAPFRRADWSLRKEDKTDESENSRIQESENADSEDSCGLGFSPFYEYRRTGLDNPFYFLRST